MSVGRSTAGAPDRALATPACVLAALALLLAAAGCTEDAIVGPGPEGSEGAETVEVILTPDDMASWRDTTFSGYALRSDAPFLLAADGDGFRSRPLLKYRTIPDSVTVDSVRHAIETYETATLRLPVDTAASELPGDDVTLTLRGLRTDWEGEEASWEEAAGGRPWGTPGGDLGRELARLDLGGVTDSALAADLTMPLDGAPVDSLLRNWNGQEGGLGAALVLEAASGDAARLRLTNARLEMGLRPAGLDTTVVVEVVPVLGEDPSTFIHDPPLPGRDGHLRLGGLPAHRFYLRFLPPDSADGVPLRQGTINRAELVFAPRSAPPSPFALEPTSTVSMVELVSDPFVTGAGTPLASGLNRRTVEPDSLAAGRPLRFAFTSLMSQWAASPDSFGTFHLGVRMDPDAQDLGFWEFSGEEAPPGQQPFVRLLVTPATTFDLP